MDPASVVHLVELEVVAARAGPDGESVFPLLDPAVIPDHHELSQADVHGASHDPLDGQGGERGGSGDVVEVAALAEV
jgi:hypothetical protein